jgi:two-component system, LuxR family, response regulator FixJ
MINEPTVYVVDDDRAVASSLSWLLETVGLPVRTYSNANEFMAAMEPDPCGCLILDVRMPGMSGLELQERLCSRGVHIPVIFITGHGGVSNAVRAIKAGALDFLEKPFDDQTLLDRVQKAIEVDASTRRSMSERATVAARRATLTPRECEVMDLVVEGRANKVIAQVLGLSSKTIEAHRAHVMEKMGARSVSELVRMALCITPTTH